jgi:hypothetical protein
LISLGRNDYTCFTPKNKTNYENFYRVLCIKTDKAKVDILFGIPECRMSKVI